MEADGGKAESIYRIGFEPSPWLTITSKGTGPVSNIQWQMMT
jgi:hypothetical protein